MGTQLEVYGKAALYLYYRLLKNQSYGVMKPSGSAGPVAEILRISCLRGLHLLADVARWAQRLGESTSREA